METKIENDIGNMDVGKHRRKKNNRQRRRENRKKREEQEKQDQEKNPETEVKPENENENKIIENKDEDKNIENKKEEPPKVSKVIEKNSKMLLFINPISKFLIKYLKKHEISEYTGTETKNGLVGLINLGNTCYMNSALQCLSNCEYLTKYFLSGYYKRELNITSKYGSGGEIAEKYAELLIKLWKENKDYINPLEFFKTFVTHVKLFANNSLHDSHEMLIYLLEKLHEDLNRNKEKQYIELNEKGENEDDIDACNRWWETHQKREITVLLWIYSQDNIKAL